MWPILSKEVSTFFNSLIAYVVLGVFLVFNGLFFWLFDGNVLNTGLAEMGNLFYFGPWLFLLLVPAITMRAFSEELQAGTLETLLTKPITLNQLLGGKFLAAVVLIVLAIAPTLVYYAMLWWLANPVGNLDHGAIWGSYIGMVLLGASFASIGLWASTLTQNQLVALIVAAFVCFFLFLGLGFLSELPALQGIAYGLAQLGMLEHYESIQRGVVDSRDVLYFLSVIFFFLLLSRWSLLYRLR